MNKKNIGIVFLAVAAIGGYLYVYGVNKRTDVDMGDFDIVHNIKYSFNLKNITPRKISDAKLWMSGPVAVNASQKSMSIESDEEPVVFRDEYNNQDMYFNYESIKREEIKHVVVDLQVAFSKQANKVSDFMADQYLSSEQYIEIENSEIVKMAAILKGVSAEDTTGNVLEWLKAHKESMSAAPDKVNVTDNSDTVPTGDVKSNIAVEEDVLEHADVDASAGALAVLNKQHNSKSGLLYLYLALNRSLGIPTRGIVGFDFSDGNNLTASKATLWAEYYDAGYWHLVDLDGFKKIQDTSTFVAFKIMNKMPGHAGWEPYSILHNEAAFVVDVASVKLTVR